MRRLFSLLIILIFTAAPIIAADNDNSLANDLFSQTDIPLELLHSGLTPSGSSPRMDLQMTETSEPLNPGKALLLSAIIPGAGEYYAGSKWRAALFFGIEVAAWTAVIYYYNEGQDKDKEFKSFADVNFSEEAYRQVEFNLARNPEWGDSGAFSGLEEEWLEKGWGNKIHYLPDQGFTHNLPTQEERDRNTGEDQQYYEMIGKYIGQFGFGWGDRYGDQLNTPFFDGTSPNSIFYMGMRDDSNTLLEYSAIATQVALLNHVASALDASFTVRAMNLRAQADIGFHRIDYDGHPMAVGGLRIRW
ncbi:MAG: DUF5683 domain-containing protein [Candidatus Electryoneaceae bacterium]|nr:DUF5683 domain-containing protein [Candidatus Electryoneaceae bacterium]